MHPESRPVRPVPDHAGRPGLITRKGLTTDYRNQENEHFRKLQSESFGSCNGNFSYYAQTYDAVVLFFSNLLGFLAFAGILFTLHPTISFPSSLSGYMVLSSTAGATVVKITSGTASFTTPAPERMAALAIPASAYH